MGNPRDWPEGLYIDTVPGFWSWSRPEPGYLAGAGAGGITFPQLRFHLKYLLNNAHKLHGT